MPFLSLPLQKTMVKDWLLINPSWTQIHTVWGPLQLVRRSTRNHPEQRTLAIWPTTACRISVTAEVFSAVQLTSSGLLSETAHLRSRLVRLYQICQFENANLQRDRCFWIEAASKCFDPKSAGFVLPSIFETLTFPSCTSFWTHKVGVAMCLIRPAPLRIATPLPAVASTFSSTAASPVSFTPRSRSIATAPSPAATPLTMEIELRLARAE